MRVRGSYRTNEFFALYAQMFKEAGLPLPGVDYILGRTRPRTPVPVPTSAEQAATVDKISFILASQRVAAGKATSIATEQASIKADLTANPPDPAKIHTPREKKETTKPPGKKRKKRKQKPRAETPKSALQWLEQAAAVVAQRRIDNEHKIDYTSAYNQSLQELKNGVFNPKHWQACEQLDQTHLQNVPTTGPDLLARSYAYPLAEKKRTLASYGNGTESTGPPRYSGNILQGEFRDTLLVWSRTTFELINPIKEKAVEPTFIEVTGTIRAYADRRGSRPMLSWVSRTWLTADESSYLTTTVPPTNKPWSWYYRYKVPHTEAPFYESVDLKHAIRTMMQPKHMEAGVTMYKAVVMIAPRPMYGRGFNNNDTVTTQFLHDIKIWQIVVEPEPHKPDHVFVLGAGGNHYVSYHWRYDPNGLFFKFYSKRTFGINLPADSYHEFCPGVKPHWTAEFDAAYGPIGAGLPRYYVDGDTGIIHPTKDCESEWCDGSVAARDAFFKANQMSKDSVSTHCYFIYCMDTGQMEILTPADYFVYNVSQIGYNLSAIFKYARPGRTLYGGGSMIQGQPPI